MRTGLYISNYFFALGLVVDKFSRVGIYLQWAKHTGGVDESTKRGLQETL
jgi:hypothetical protein